MASFRVVSSAARGLLFVVALLLVGPSVFAQRPPLECAPIPEREAPSDDAMKEARTRYKRAEELYEDGAYEQALLEFDRAYELAPAYRILYNIGQVAMILNDYPRAIEAFEQYLCEGKGKIEPKRKKLVEKGLDTLYGRVAYIEVETNVEGAEIIVDDISRGRTPLDEPIMVNAGRHRIVGKKPGRMGDEETVTLAGTDRTKIEFELLEPPKDAPPTVPGTPGGPERPPPPEPDRSWIGWVATGTFTAGAVVTGLLALNASSDLDELKNTFGTTREQLDDKESERMALAVTTDVLAGLAVVSAGLSTWWTIAENDGPDVEGGDTASKIDVLVGPSSFGVRGRF